MTNLQRWLMFLGLLITPYVVVDFGIIKSEILHEWIFELKILPIVCVLLFGIYAAVTVLYRAFTFNDCPEAAKELLDQIVEARKDLIARGFKFRD